MCPALPRPRPAVCVRAECCADPPGRERLLGPLHRPCEGRPHQRLVQVQRRGDREDGGQEAAAGH